jgi:2-desacetyl-2-hydroxyethyl bacteriochlorophyllide A dehydrogenase
VAQRVVFPEPHRVALEEFECDPLDRGSVRVRTEWSLISTGTEGIALHQLFAPGTHWADYVRYPFTPGYAAVGTITELGDGVEDLAVGERVAARVGHASEHVVPAALCTRVPDAIAADNACWFALAKIALMGQRAANYRIGDSVAIIGAGPVGQMSVRWAVAAGARHVVAIDGDAPRLEHASRGGATAVVDAALPEGHDAVVAACGGSRPRVVIDCTGHAGVLQHALPLAADRGRVVLLGDTGHPGEQRLTPDVITRGVQVHGAHDNHSMWTRRWDGDRALHELFFELVGEDASRSTVCTRTRSRLPIARRRTRCSVARRGPRRWVCCSTGLRRRDRVTA